MTRIYGETLGKVFLCWTLRLAGRLDELERAGAGRPVFCLPEGKRIVDLLEAFSGRPRFDRNDLLSLSPLAALGLAAVDPAGFRTAERLAADLPGSPTLADLCRSCLGPLWREDDALIAGLGRLRQPCTGPNLRALIAANDPASRFLRGHLCRQREALGEWLAGRAPVQAPLPEIVLVSARPQPWVRAVVAGITGGHVRTLCFGTTGVPNPGEAEALVFAASAYRRWYPASVLAAYPDLVDDILRSNASVPLLSFGQADAALQAVAHETTAPERDALFRGILDHIRDNARLSSSQIEANHRDALANLVPLLLTPTRKDALALAPSGTGLERNIWPQGRIALDHPPEKARRLQMARSEDVHAFFTAHEADFAASWAGDASGKPPGWAGSVAVVTRTKNRPLLFARAARSVVSQTWQNMHWVIVNDGGDGAPVRQIIADSGIDPARITLLENAASVGMEAASNMGVRAVDTEFVVIHDDDDRWEPDFLQETVAFLQSPRAAAAGFEGVLSRAWRVSERIEGDRVVTLGAEPYMPWVSEVALTQMAVGNFFAPISFLYRRSVYDQIGGYDERLPVLGDWRFNLDFLIRANIGFLDRYLSFYHHRDTGDGDQVYTNSVVGARGLHGQYFSVVTNALLRDPATPEALRIAVANAHQQRVMEQNFASLRRTVHQLEVRLERAEARAADPLTAGGDGTAGRLPVRDLEHVRRSVRAALPYTLSPQRIVARARWDLRLARLEDPEARRRDLPRLFHLIPSPHDFDHISYLRDHPEIWATRFNGPDEWLPYHHYLLEGAARGHPRPTLPEI